MAELKIKMVGNRPCADIDPEKVENLKKIVVPVIEDVIGEKVTFDSSSTDCNIPLSRGVAALCIGTNIHKGIHTREEWVDKESIVTGLKIAIGVGKELIIDN